MTHDDVSSRAEALRATGTPFVLATVVASYRPQSARAGAKAIILRDGSIVGWFGGGCARPVVLDEAMDALQTGEPRLVRLSIEPASTHSARVGIKEYPMACQGEGGLEVFLDPVLPRSVLGIFGNTPVAHALARFAAALEFDIRVAASADAASLFPEGATLSDDAAAVAAALPAEAYAVIATMGVGDEDALRAAAESPAHYVGIVASRKKGTALIDYVSGLGVPDDRLGRVKFPAGLDLGGMRPSEIALSIMAEIVQDGARRGRGMPNEGIVPVAAPARARDPICGMSVDMATAKHSATYEGRTYYFCCPHCKTEFERSPAQHAAA